jgi:DNA-directed RNA polymerase specialized sigma24 family protein
VSLYADFGLFVWAKGLAKRGSYSPARQVFLIGRTLASERSSHALAASGGTPPQSVVDAAIERGIARFASEQLVPLEQLYLPAEPAWDPHDALAELIVADCGAQAIRSVKGRLSSAGLGMGYGELHDVSTAFVNAHLRAAVRSFDPVRGEGKEAAWLSTVLYRYALQHGLISRRLDSNFEAVLEVRDPAPSFEEREELKESERALRMLPGAIERLPKLQRNAIALYFGLSGREHAIKEVAQALDTNFYFARLAVVQGVVALAAELGAEGLLSQDDLKLARALFVEGEDAGDAARALGISRATVKSRMSQIGDKVKASLRQRTVVPSFPSDGGDTAMPQSPDVLSASLWRDLTTHRWRMERLDLGEVVVIGEQTKEPVSVERARRLLRDRVDELVAAGGQIEEDVARLFAPQGPREDLSEEDAQWASLLQTAVQSSLQGVETLVQRWKEDAEKAGVGFSLTDAELAERVRDSLATVTSALEQAMPRAGRRQGTAQLWIRFGKSEQDAVFGWVDVPEKGEPMRLLPLIRHRLGFVGDFEGLGLDLLARCTVRGLQEGWAALPRFTFTSPRREESRWTWTKPGL